MRRKRVSQAEALLPLRQRIADARDWLAAPGYWRWSNELQRNVWINRYDNDGPAPHCIHCWLHGQECSTAGRSA